MKKIQLILIALATLIFGETIFGQTIEKDSITISLQKSQKAIQEIEECKKVKVDFIFNQDLLVETTEENIKLYSSIDRLIKKNDSLKKAKAINTLDYKDLKKEKRVNVGVGVFVTPTGQVYGGLGVQYRIFSLF